MCSEVLLDDFMLTHPIFLTAERFQQVLLQRYPPTRPSGAAGTFTSFYQCSPLIPAVAPDDLRSRDQVAP